MKKNVSLLVVIALLFSLWGCGPKKDPKEEQKLFDEFIQRDFVDTMENDFVGMHVYFENPEKFGIDKEKVKIQLAKHYSEEDNEEEEEEFEELIEEFEEFDRDLLTDEQQETYDICEYLIELSEESFDDDFTYLENVFTSLSGIHTVYPTLFSDYILRNEEDVKDLIVLLKDVKPYTSSLLEYTKKQAKEGYLMVDIDDVIEKSQDVLNQGFESTTYKNMCKSIENLQLGYEKTNQYKNELKEAYTSSYLEAYKEIISVMIELKKEKNNSEGLAKFKKGKEYYEYLFKIKVSSERSVEDTKALLEEKMDEAVKEMTRAAFMDGESYMALVEGDITTNYTSFEEILLYLEEKAKEDFPTISKLKYDINPLSEDLVNAGIAAYFNVPAIDNSRNMSIFVNMSNGNNMNGIDTFTTVVHEGIPGHMYQYSYAYENLDNVWRKTVPTFHGYVEGYATYAELFGLNYVDELDEDIKKLYKNMNLSTMYLYALADIGIHYEGWSLEDLRAFMNSHGLNGEVADQLYEPIQQNPATFSSYYVGYLEFNELREAMEKLGSNFNNKEFHEAILKSGAAPFRVVKDNVEEYIEAND